MAPYSSTLVWKTPGTEEPCGLQSMGSPRVGHDWATSLSLFTFMHWRRKWQPTPVFLPGESQRQWAPVYGVTQSRTRLKWLSSSSSSNRQNSFIVLEVSGASPIHPVPHSPEFSATTDLFIVSILLPFPECHVVGTTQYVAFSDWLLSFSHMHLCFLQAFCSLQVYFFPLLNNIPLFGCPTFYPFTYWKTTWLLSSFDNFK